LETEKNIEIEIITDDDDSLKILGELLANKTSRDLMKFLMSKSEYKKKISDEIGVPFSLVEHHLKKLEKLGLVKITNKRLIKGGVLHKTYKIKAKGIFLMLNATKEEVEEKGTLKKIFKEGVKFTCIGVAAITTLFISKTKLFRNDDSWLPMGQSDLSVELALTIIIFGLLLLYLLEKKKKG
jgi:DNA-binding transcriptional ArsR family regulator